MAAPITEPPHLAADLKTLCLSTIAAQWRPLAEQATRQRQAPADYLAQLAHLEVTGRRERRIQRRMQDARFPMLKTLDAFSFDAQPDLGRDAVLQVFGCGFVAEAANIVLVGGVGTGKTHLAIALGMACCQHDYRVRFVTAAELVTLLVEAQQQRRLQRKLARRSLAGPRCFSMPRPPLRCTAAWRATKTSTTRSVSRPIRPFV